jgi:hypothetical protein
MSYIREQLEWAKQKEEEKENERIRATMNDLVYRGDVLDIVLLDPGIATGQLEMILGLPPVKLEKKKGKWIVDKEKSKYHIEKIYKCSACNNFDAWGGMELYNYCPHCGAKMEVDNG